MFRHTHDPYKCFLSVSIDISYKIIAWKHLIIACRGPFFGSKAWWNDPKVPQHCSQLSFPNGTTPPSHSFTSPSVCIMCTHLVGGWALPLWKIWLRQWGWWHSQYMESHKIHVQHHQPAIKMDKYMKWWSDGVKYPSLFWSYKAGSRLKSTTPSHPSSPHRIPPAPGSAVQIPHGNTRVTWTYLDHCTGETGPKHVVNIYPTWWFKQHTYWFNQPN